MKSYLRILRYVGRFRKYAAYNIFFNILFTFFNLFSILLIIPFLQILFDTYNKQQEANPSGLLSPLLGWINSNFTSYIEANGKSAGLVLVCIAVVCMFFLKNICRYFALYYLAPLRNGVVRDLRQGLFDKMMQLPVSYFSEKRKGDILARITTDVNEVEWSVMNTLESTFRDPFTIIIFFISMLFISVPLTLLVIVFLIPTAFIITRIGKSLKRKSTKSQTQFGLIMSIIEESLGGLRIIKGFNAERYQKSKFSRENKILSDLQIGVLHRWQLSSPLTEFLSIITVAVILYLGGMMVLQGDSTLGADTFIGYILIFANILNPARSAANSFFYIQRGIASIERIEAVLDADVNIKEPLHATHLKTFEHEIEYKNVSFNYQEDIRVLHNINVKIEKGKMIALVGSSGSGKSTLADLLARFHDVTDGEILIDDINIKDIRIASLRNLLGIVTQESILFNDTIFNNIAFGIDNANEDAVIKAAKVANAHEFIMKQEKGYQTMIGDRGHKLSGGERQRITIARAIFKNPPILILDEATSSLDTESEKLVQDALFKLMQNRTSIVIAHRLSTIQFADEILVMQNGQIAEKGNHTSLLAKNGLYAKLVEMQMF
ncbi:MAG: ABC transporter ATP-binding protein [Chitinophagales bacterium]